MQLNDEQDVLKWYRSGERTLNKAFLDEIPWGEVKKYPLDPSFIPVLVYMRDVERYTEVYYKELKGTPTVKDTVIKSFMDQWEDEEVLHADLLHRFLGEMDYPTDEKWYEKVRQQIPKSYHMISKLQTLITNGFGKHFTSVHMTWGAINEMSTMAGYQRLWKLAKHPILEQILRGIVQEEGKHSFFYWNIARLKLNQSKFRQDLTRFIVKHFWSPVGEGTKSKADSNYVIRALFGDPEGISVMDKIVNQRMEQLPGMAGLKAVTERISQVASLA